MVLLRPASRGRQGEEEGELFIALLIFELFQVVDAVFFWLAFAVDAEGVLSLVEGIDFVGHEVGDVFFGEFDFDGGAVFFLETQVFLPHVEGSDDAGDVQGAAGLLAGFYVVLEGFGDGGGVFVGNGEGAATGVACPGDIQRKIVLVHVLVEGLHGLHHYHQPGGRSRPGSSECT